MISARFAPSSMTLRPPLYGYESPSPRVAAMDVKSWPTHHQHLLRVRGRTSEQSHAQYSLRTSLYVRGAHWRSQTDALCTALDTRGPEHELKACSAREGAFNAALWLFIPGTVPQHWWLRTTDVPTQARDLRAYIDRPCEWIAPLWQKGGWDSHLASAIAAACSSAGGRQLTLGQLFGEPRWSQQGKQAKVRASGSTMARFWEAGHQVWGETMAAMGVAFLEAARTLPQPYTIVESGNLCGGSTTLLALLKKRFCPSCPFVSADPGWYRVHRRQNLSCPQETLAWAGLRQEVNVLYDGSALVTLSIPRTKSLISARVTHAIRTTVLL